jgi:MarR family transcriptional regulator, transcriptional regulator for hemolysin
VTAEPTPSLAQLINRASRALTRKGDAALIPLGFRYAQVPVLALLRTRSEMTQSALAAATGIEQPSMAQLLTRMERDGLIRTAPNPRDARSRTITLTPDATARLREADGKVRAVNDEALNGLTEQEIQTLKDLLTRLNVNLEHQASAGADGPAT